MSRVSGIPALHLGCAQRACNWLTVLTVCFKQRVKVNNKEKKIQVLETKATWKPHVQTTKHAFMNCFFIQFYLATAFKIWTCPQTRLSEKYIIIPDLYRFILQVKKIIPDLLFWSLTDTSQHDIRFDITETTLTTYKHFRETNILPPKHGDRIVKL